jgi:hypothetical protein
MCHHQIDFYEWQGVNLGSLLSKSNIVANKLMKEILIFTKE